MPRTFRSHEKDFRHEPSTCCSAAPIADAAVEIRCLQRENDYLRRQREIIKSLEHTLRGPAERYALIDFMRENPKI
jgi:transposase-like protein